MEEKGAKYTLILLQRQNIIESNTNEHNLSVKLSDTLTMISEALLVNSFLL